MPRQDLSARSSSQVTNDSPADAPQPDNVAVQDVHDQVSQTGSLEAAARKLQQHGRSRGVVDDPEEAEYRTGGAASESFKGKGAQENEIVHLQEVVEGLWIGDLVAAMNTTGLEERGIVRRSSSTHDAY